MRLGFSNPLSAVAKPVALAWFILAFPVASRWALASRRREKAPSAAWTSSYAFLSLLGLTITAFLGRLVPVIGINPFPVIALIGVVAFALILIRWITSAPFWRSATVLSLSVVFGGWAAGVVWGRIYKNPLFLENLMLDGKVHHDTLHLASFANMLRNYHVASTGIDGIPYIPYHWGTPWLFAQWSNLIGSRVIDFYQLGFPVTMIPFFFAGVLAFAVGFRERRRTEPADPFRTSLSVWLIFLAACIGVIPLASLDALGVWTSNYLISESYTVAVPAAILVMGVAIAFFDDATRVEQSARGRVPLSEWLFYVAFAPLAVIGLGYLKISLILLAFPVALYAFLRLRLWTRLPAVVSAVLLIVGCYVAYRRVSLPGHYEGFARFDFMKTYVPLVWWPFFFLVHLAWSWAYAAFRLRQANVNTLSDLRAKLGDRSLLDVEVLAVVALFGLAPGLLLHIDGGSAFYFSDVQRWIALALLLSFGPEFIRFLGFARDLPSVYSERQGSWRNVSTATVLRWFIAVPLLVTIAVNAAVWPARMVRANGETRRGLYALEGYQGLPAGIHAWLRLRDPVNLARGLAASPNYGVTTGLASLAAFDVTSRRQTALFIPQTQTAYWTALTRPGACTYQSFIAPAITGMAMIDGMPAYGCPLSRYYGLGAFHPRSRPQTNSDTQPAALCARAKPWGMSRIVVATFAWTGVMQLSLIKCQGSN
ncbi:MAG TPA: hypothetical protein VIF83_06560 [Gemmatimonadaceae bacterium]